MTGPSHVLVAHPSRATCDAVRAALEQAGFTTLVTAATGDLRIEERGLALAVLEARFALERADRVLERLRRERIPVVCIAPTQGEEDAASVLESGADDVVREPFSPRELVARVRAVLRGYARSRSPGELVRLGPIAVDRGRREASVRGRPIELTRSELELLGHLVASPGRVFRREELLGLILASGKHATPRLIDTHMVSLRRKLGVAGRWIETIRGYGYRARSEDGDSRG